MTRLRASASRQFLAISILVGSISFAADKKEPDRTPIKPEIVGRLTENSYLTPTNQVLTPAGKQVGLPGIRPQTLALSPDGAIVVTSGKAGELLVIDPVSGKLLQTAVPAEKPKTVPAKPAGGPGKTPKDQPGEPRPGGAKPGSAKAGAKPGSGKADAPKSEGEETDPDAGEKSPTQLGVEKGVPPSFTGLVFSPDGSRVYASSASGGIKVFSVDAAHVAKPLLTLATPSANAPKRKSEIPAGLAVSADGKKLYVAGNLGNRLSELDAVTGKSLRTWNTGVAPFDVVLVGSKAYVSNSGGRRPVAGDITAPAGRGTKVKVDRVRYIASEGSVTVIDLAANAVKKEIMVGLHASAMAASPDGSYVVVANTGDDNLSVIDTKTDAVVEKIWTRQTPGDLFGAQPNALAFNASGKRLYVCNGSQNAVAVFNFEANERESKLLGLVPVGWFPGAIRFDATRKALYVANIKGIGAAKAPKPPETAKPGDAPKAGEVAKPGETLKPAELPKPAEAAKPGEAPKISDPTKPGEAPKPGSPAKAPDSVKNTSKDFFGTISIIPVPNEEELKVMTVVSLQNMRYAKLAEAKLPPRAGQPARPVPERVGEPSVFKHVIYIIKENRTYDQVLGDMKEGNGMASLCTFGEKYTPNQHKIAREFVLLDNTYCSGVQSADGHQWTDSGITNAYMERQVTSAFPRSYPGGKTEDGSDALAWASSGFIWDHALAHGKTFRNYGEWMFSEAGWVDKTRKDKPKWVDFWNDYKKGTGLTKLASRPGIESLRKVSKLDGVGWDLNVPDVMRAAAFIKELKAFEEKGDLPNFVLLFLPNDHTGGTRSPSPTPGAQAADNDLALGQVVEALSNSKFWKDTCLLAIEDDPQNGWDHVSGYRTTCYIASAYTKRRTTVSDPYNQTSVLRTMELMLGLSPMNQLDATAIPMSTCFTDKPDFTPFKSVPNQVPLDTFNPAPNKIKNPILREDALTSAKLNLEEPDKCPEDVLNKIIWHAMKGTKVPFPEWAVTLVEDDDD